MATALAGRSFIGTFGLVVLAIAALSVADVFLANMERAETHTQAANLFAQGQALIARGENAQAIDKIEDAIAIDRANRLYQRSLVEAQFAAGKDSDAETTLATLLDADSTDGFASLMMGRIAAKEGRSADAVSYFHRAIYGHWNDHESDNRQRARFELIDYLAAHNSKEELLAELLPVAEHPPRDIKSRAHLGQLFLMAGSPSHAADMFRTIVHDQPSSAEAHAGLAEADFARADYRSAQRNFQDALRFDPSDQAVRRRLDLCDELLQLDPTLRGIDSQERQQRSAKLVELTAAEVTRCVPENQSPELKILLGTAASASKARSSEANLDLAEQLWQARKKECRAAPDAETPLALVLARLAR